MPLVHGLWGRGAAGALVALRPNHFRTGLWGDRVSGELPEANTVGRARRQSRQKEGEGPGPGQDQGKQKGGPHGGLKRGPPCTTRTEASAMHGQPRRLRSGINPWFDQVIHNLLTQLFGGGTAVSHGGASYWMESAQWRRNSFLSSGRKASARPTIGRSVVVI